ncbi:MAG: Hsp70 family protein, partial [Firmicutes bacterium]|nr:Hsp70 family protein [Bacillota bacterium]
FCQSPTNLTQEEINKMVKDAAVYAEEDGKKRDEAQSRNRANTELDTAERTLRELADRIALDQVRKVRDAMEKLRLSLQTYDIERIKNDSKVLTDALYSISTEAYLAVGGEKLGARGQAKDKGVIIEEEPSEEDLFDWFKK